MAETLELQQVKCPSCKQVMSSFSPYASQVECPYCHNKAFNPLITAKKVPVPERVIIFKTNEGDFENALTNNLIEQDYVPKDIFQCINPENVIRAYLPMYLFEGKYQSSWSCKVAVETTELRANASGDKIKNKKVKKFTPHTGTSQGNFAFLCLAYEGKDIPEELRTFSAQFPYNSLSSKEYDPVFLELDGTSDTPLTTVPMDTDADLVWSKYGDSLVKQLAYENAEEQLSGEEVKDFKASNSYELKNNGRLVLAPFWFVYYTYNNEKHYFIMDGLGENVAGSTPVDQEEVKFVNDKEKIKKIVKWLWILAIPLIFIVDFATALIYAIVWFISKFIVNKVMNKQIKSKLDDSKEARRQAAAQI